MCVYVCVCVLHPMEMNTWCNGIGNQKLFMFPFELISLDKDMNLSALRLTIGK